MKNKHKQRIERHKKIRKVVIGKTSMPRLSVFRSNGHIYAQIIDDEKHRTIAGSSDLSVKTGSKLEKAKSVGENIAKIAVGKKIKNVVFDRGGYKYHGRVKELAEAARKGGLTF